MKTTGAVKNSNQSGGTLLLKITVVFFILGVVTGSVADPASYAPSLNIAEYFRCGYSASVSELLWASIKLLIPFAVAFLVCALMAAGWLFIPVIIALRGLELGAFSRLIFSQLGIASGLPCAALLILPGAVISSALLIFIARDSIRLSGYFWNCAVGRESTEALSKSFKKYIIKFPIYLFLLFASTLVDALCGKLYFWLVRE